MKKNLGASCTQQQKKTIKQTKYFPLVVWNVHSNLNVNSQFSNKKNLIMKPFESWLIAISKANIAKPQVHNLQATLKTNFGNYKWFFTIVLQHFITRGG